tara:strand:- start:286 stop:537 length:252 start_codon:yes stop_codon:yes gene_type:complete
MKQQKDPMIELLPKIETIGRKIDLLNPYYYDFGKLVGDFWGENKGKWELEIQMNSLLKPTYKLFDDFESLDSFIDKMCNEYLN